jgi:putative chitinase
VVVVTPPPEATATPEQYFVYKVVVGDTVGEIAEKFKVDPEVILALNDLADPDLLSAGMELKIPGEAPPEYGGPTTYEVQRGDTLTKIAAQFGVTVQELQSLNQLADPDLLHVGQKLRIPTGATPAATSKPKQTYTVQRGDTLFAIALRFGVTTRALQAANDIADPDRIYVGQVLTIP